MLQRRPIPKADIPGIEKLPDDSTHNVLEIFLTDARAEMLSGIRIGLETEQHKS
jgi:hypothetical protein